MSDTILQYFIFGSTVFIFISIFLVFAVAYTSTELTKRLKLWNKYNCGFLIFTKTCRNWIA